MTFTLFCELSWVIISLLFERLLFYTRSPHHLEYMRIGNRMWLSICIYNIHTYTIIYIDKIDGWMDG